MIPSSSKTCECYQTELFSFHVQIVVATHSPICSHSMQSMVLTHSIRCKVHRRVLPQQKQSNSITLLQLENQLKPQDPAGQSLNNFKLVHACFCFRYNLIFMQKYVVFFIRLFQAFHIYFGNIRWYDRELCLSRCFPASWLFVPRLVLTVPIQSV